MSGLNGATLLIARLIMGGYFIYNGINHLTNHAFMTSYASSYGVPQPGLAVAATGLMLLIGGASLLIGVWPKFGAALLVIFLLGVTPVMHAFWLETEQQARMSQMINFTKNFALLGGLLFAMAVPQPWPLSVAGSEETTDPHGQRFEPAERHG